ncbi:COG1361 S-layer family protein [Haloarcula sp. KBTZ06]|uniref:Sialidase n=1 Tax=Haloarcula hispanica TaxID=51589 RepID=A0A482TEL1_HALHI|nr:MULTISPECIES: sialidase [Haloarcula]AJF26206.1 sialidase [Haloarcula sp. CBA1115]KAA9407982.1 sialidase [Haloarcula sp. CBA1131]KAA9408971.1 sialidase [Haloarcula hispanica]MCJ0621001.1 sialidase [Haloarcula hispanica]MUV51114.1 sialidase [Haloarcula sp. CBA1122]
MKPRTLLTLAVVALLMASGTAIAAVTGSPDFDATFVDNTVTPGEETTLDVVLVNSGTIDSGSSTQGVQSSEVTTARGTTVKVNDGDAPITVTTSKQAVGSVPEGKTQPISFDISVADDASPGSYTVPVIVEYEYTSYISESDGARDEETTTERIELELDIDDDAAFDVVSVDSDARVDSTGTVAVTVENTGDEPARESSVTLKSTNSELTVGGDASSSRFIDTWEAGEQRTLRYRVGASGDTRAEPYQFDLQVDFDDTDGVRKSTTASSLGITPDPEQTFTVESTDSDVAVGDSGTYNVTLRNDGPVTVSDATVSLATQNTAITFGQSESTSQFVGSWEPGETRTVSVDASASDDAKTQSYALSASVSYDDPEGDAGVADDISLGLTPEPEQSFAMGDVESTLQAGDDGTIEASLTNTGDRTVRNVVLNWASTHDNISPKETQYAVGDLEPGESTTVSFDADVSDNANSGPRQFDFVANYRNSEGDQRESDTLEIRQSVDGSADEFIVETTNASVDVGGSSTLEVTITNDAGERLTDIEAKLFAESPISVSDDQAYVDSLDQGESTTIEFGISASGAAMTKNYPVSVDFQYEEPDGDTPVSDTYRLPVSVTNSGGGSSPLTAIIGVALVAALAIGGYFRFR